MALPEPWIPAKVCPGHYQEVKVATEMDSIDPKYLSFDYKLVFNISKAKMASGAVYDDGKKTYIVFDEQTLQMELPGFSKTKLM